MMMNTPRHRTLNPSAETRAANVRARVSAGVTHPGALISLAQDILIRADELAQATRDGADYEKIWAPILDRRRALANDLIAEGRDLIAVAS